MHNLGNIIAFDNDKIATNRNRSEEQIWGDGVFGEINRPA